MIKKILSFFEREATTGDNCRNCSYDLSKVEILTTIIKVYDKDEPFKICPECGKINWIRDMRNLNA